MKVLKFGGTSVGSARRIKEVANLITGRGTNIIVLSAMSGTTNTLVEIADYLYKGNTNGAREIINSLEKRYATVMEELFASGEYLAAARERLSEFFHHLRSFTRDGFTVTEEKEILAQG